MFDIVVIMGGGWDTKLLVLLIGASFALHWGWGAIAKELESFVSLLIFGKCRVKKRREIFNFYQNELSDIDEITFLEEYQGAFSNYWLTTILLEENSIIDREKLRLNLHNDCLPASGAYQGSYRWPSAPRQPLQGSFGGPRMSQRQTEDASRPHRAEPFERKGMEHSSRAFHPEAWHNDTASMVSTRPP